MALTGLLGVYGTIRRVEILSERKGDHKDSALIEFEYPEQVLGEISYLICCRRKEPLRNSIILKTNSSKTE